MPRHNLDGIGWDDDDLDLGEDERIVARATPSRRRPVRRESR
jgi:hypothetical protein